MQAYIQKSRSQLFYLLPVTNYQKGGGEKRRISACAISRSAWLFVHVCTAQKIQNKNAEKTSDRW
jgi:hypothetical protein